ncbi:MAG TPA: hypothetical protein VIX14_12155 [Terriglobales bacterium]
MQSCWHHSIACAIVAERSANWRFLDKDSAIRAGFCTISAGWHLATSMPEAYARVVERGTDHPQDILQNERELCGIDLCQAGHW